MRFPALRSPSFRLYETGSFFALNGQWITRIVIGWVAWELTGSASWVGLLSFFLFAPTLAAGPFFGVLMDRVRLRSAAIISHGIITLTTLVLFLLHVGGMLTIWGLAGLALIIGIGGSADRAVRVTIVPRMVDMHVLPNAVAIHASNFNIARLIGPAVGGILIDRFGVSTTMFVNVLVLAPFLFALFLLKVRDNEAAKTGRTRFFAEFRDGARYAAKHPVIREALVLTCITSLTVRGVLEILPTLADGVFQRGAEGLGHMVAAGGAGALVAALTIATRQTAKWGDGIPLIAHVGVFLGLFAVTGLGLSGNWTAAILLVALCGFCGTTIGINMQSTIQLSLEDIYRGRVMSLWMVAGIGTSALGALILGVLADIFGLSETLVGAGIIGALAAFAIRLVHVRAAQAD